MERRSIVPPNMSNKPRNGPISPRDHRSDYNHQQQPSHYNNYNSVNHHSSHNSHHQNSSQQSHHHHSHHQSAPPPPPQQSYHPNSDLIHFVSSAWKEKIASDKTEYFKSESTEKYREFDFDSWINAKMRNSS